MCFYMLRVIGIFLAAQTMPDYLFTILYTLPNEPFPTAGLSTT